MPAFYCTVTIGSSVSGRVVEAESRADAAERVCHELFDDLPESVPYVSVVPAESLRPYDDREVFAVETHVKFVARPAKSFEL